MKKFLIISTMAISAALQAATYNCKGDYIDAEVRINKKSLVIKNGSHVGQGTLDESYKPRGNKNYSRFEGDFDSFGEGSVSILVEDALLEGETYGHIKIQSRGEGFLSETFSCTKK